MKLAILKRKQRLLEMTMPLPSRRVILVTGGTSGIGLACCQSLARQDRLHIILVGPNSDRVETTVKKLRKHAKKTTLIEGRCTDMSRLSEVRVLVGALIAEHVPLFALVCNAACECAETSTTPDGFETTFATNYLGHFLLAASLFHGGAFVGHPDAASARVIVLSSRLHENERFQVPAPDVEDWDVVAHGGSKMNPNVAFSTSMLCNSLFGAEFQRRYGDRLRAYTYEPGFVPRTALYRHRSQWRWRLTRAWLRVATIWDADLRHARSSPERSGAFLARLASETELPFKGGAFLAIDDVVKPTEQAQDRELACQLWERSMKWISG